MSEKLKELERKCQQAEKKMIAARNREKYLDQELKRLTRSERTHRLCTRGGMLESFLQEPTLLTDDDVMELLAFREDIQQKMGDMLEKRAKETESDEIDPEFVLAKQ